MLFENTKNNGEIMRTLDCQESQYRDRAKERREKFGLDNRVHPDRLKQKYMESRSR